MPTRSPVTVLGLGPMGQAMARSLMRAGHPVTVWNRTPRRAEDVVAAGAQLADTPAQAIEAGELSILSLTDYQAMWDVLGDATASLRGRTLANLSSDTPDRTREAAAWAADHGATFLTGGVMVPAPMIGTEAAYAYYSGPREAMERHRETLTRIGTPRYLGEDPGLAQLMYLAHLDVFLTTLSSLTHAIALLQSEGLKASDVFPELMPTLVGIPAVLEAGGSPAAQIDAGEHPGNLSTATMMGATADHIVAASERAGIDLALPRAVQRHYARAIDDGHGGDNWTRIIDGIRTPNP
ncbi:3-hydroxyisobutyrate dehydrogenase-like beta-hydroxyacid dehydrogenase [Streptomyces sp. TLI_55]|uniref:NAD(P)-dependent oxidoreductase n=1 Tax=Streptomyces sp. TLI_55 TaxID=1938861 RepID=UPI000BDD959A|nr:NAD(P)-binding domain-containing protein [Streptomyces sp. TLI_55]SNX66090.1 3-hydroxyisobutyrate dehydrogenase-like beta-hydroxyacid dehydrogenase [Streptomyces sp. TLI_55]